MYDESILYSPGGGYQLQHLKRIVCARHFCRTMTDTLITFLPFSDSAMDVNNDREHDLMPSSLWNVPSTSSSSAPDPDTLLGAIDWNDDGKHITNRSYRCYSDSGPSSVGRGHGRSTGPLSIIHTPPLISMGDPFADKRLLPEPLSLSELSMPSVESSASESRSTLSARRRFSAPDVRSMVWATTTTPKKQRCSGGNEEERLPVEREVQDSFDVESRSQKSDNDVEMIQDETEQENVSKPSERTVVCRLATYKWTEIEEFSFGLPIVEIRPYNKADGKRYVYLNVEISEFEEEPIQVKARLESSLTGERLGFLKSRSAENDSSNIITLKEHLALLVSEEIVKALDERGIGKGCPLDPGHGLKVSMLRVKDDGSDGDEIASASFFRIKRRQKRLSLDVGHSRVSKKECSAVSKKKTSCIGKTASLPRK